jgi:tetratricopeptide (TPR) repeat protein
VRTLATVVVIALLTVSSEAGQRDDTSARLAAVRARRAHVIRLANQLQSEPAMRTMRVTETQRRAYVAALQDVDPGTLANQVRALHRDQDAAAAVTKAWERIETLERSLSDPDAAPVALVSVEAEYVIARLSAALARTVESPIGGRAPSPAGRQLARTLADEALALAPDSARVRGAYGDVLLDAGQPEPAEQEYRRALTLDPGFVDARVRLAEAMRLQGNGLEAVEELREALRIDPRSARAHSDLGFILRSIGSTTEAMFHYQEARRLAPDSIDVHNGFAVLLASQGRLPEAAAEFREINRIDPDYSVGYYNLATVLADMDEDAASAAALREVVRINPGHYNAHYNLGELFRLDGKFDDAAVQFREYLKLVPSTPANQRSIQRAKNLLQSWEEPAP